MFSRQNIELFGVYISRSSHPEFFYEKCVLKGIVKSPMPCRYVILLISKII